MQDSREWELLISDDGSTDGARDYLDGLNDDRIRLFKQAKNLGIFGNLNFLVSQASAPICQILCQDDYFMSPHGAQYIIDAWSRMPDDVGVLRCNWGDLSRSPLERNQLEVVPKKMEPSEAAIYYFLFGCLEGNLSNCSFRRTLVAEAGWFNQKFPFAGDFQFWIRANRKTSVMFDATRIIFIRSHEGQASN